tara:strand:- start:5398 stop:7185 length:1788 start_codon:yes stop_codon:yes gene_type:complete
MKINKSLRLLLILSNDIFLCALALCISFYLRIEQFLSFDQFIKIFPILVGIYVMVFFIFRVNVQFFRFITYKSIFYYSKIFVVFLTLIIFFFVLFQPVGIPRSISIIHPIIFFILLGINRQLVKYFFDHINNNVTNNIIIIGFNKNTNSIISSLPNSKKIKAFVDINNTNRSINGINVYHISKIYKLINQLNINEIIIADKNLFIDNLELERLKNLKTKISEIIIHNNITKVQPFFDFNFFFKREIIKHDIKNKFINTNILVTGGGGSIGSEIVNKITSSLFNKLIIIEFSEINLYNLNENLSKLDCFNKIILVLGDIKDEKLHKEILVKHKIDIVFHTAAYKHVPILEDNILQAINNNFLATYNFAKNCLSFNVSKFILISSDKAVRSTNIMGATKRLSELAIDYLNQIARLNKENIIFSSVRFGNVINSSGSVLPLFRSQINNGGPVTITDPNITRYFMTIEEASDLVIQSSFIMKGGETFLLDMGDPIRIFDLVQKLIQFSGFTIMDDNNPTGDIRINSIGLRPGEKLFEELLIDHMSAKTKLNSIFLSTEKKVNINEFETILNTINTCIEDNDMANFKSLLKLNIIGYKKS